MIEIDGSQGEGGGQVLRSALTLSMMTRQPTHITQIRANRSKPGLRAQHLTAVRAAIKIGGAQADGAAMGSEELSFWPGKMRPGRYQFDIPTAGAATLVLQTVFLPLSQAKAPSTLTITGGTHVPWSPCFHYLDWQWLYHLGRIGFDARFDLERMGFYPQGAGRIRARIRPAGTLSPLRLKERGSLREIRGLSVAANLPRHIAERQRRQAVQRLGQRCPTRIKIVDLPARNKGTFLLLLAEFEHAQCCFFSLGRLGKPAEHVADEAVDELVSFLDTDCPVDPYLADQLLLPLAFAGGESHLRTSKVTQHLVTNAQVLRAFLPLKIEIQGEIGEPGMVRLST